MVDYTAIADGDPGGDLEAAYATMLAETITQSRGQHPVTDLRVAGEIGLAAAEEFFTSIEAVVSSRVIGWFRTTGVDINHPDTIATLNAINPPHKDAVLAMGNETVSKYPGLTIEHLKKARTKRAAGEI